VALAVAPLVVLDDQRTVAVHDDHLAATALGFVMGLDDLQTLVVHGPGVLGIEHVLLGRAACRAADVERAHRELGARLANRLRRDAVERAAIELNMTTG